MKLEAERARCLLNDKVVFVGDIQLFLLFQPNNHYSFQLFFVTLQA